MSRSTIPPLQLMQLCVLLSVTLGVITSIKPEGDRHPGDHQQHAACQDQLFHKCNCCNCVCCCAVTLDVIAGIKPEEIDILVATSSVLHVNKWIIPGGIVCGAVLLFWLL
jgi:hypothetical protein